MHAVVTLTIVLLTLAFICLALICLHNRSAAKRSGQQRFLFRTIAHKNNLLVSVTEELRNTMLGIDYDNKKILVLREQEGELIDLAAMKQCRKQKKWLHIPACKDNSRPETHLEKMMLVCEYAGHAAPVELVFYEYRYNSLFQLNELEQKADYWELLINQQIKKS